MAHSPEFWFFMGSFFVLFLFVGECLNAYSFNTGKQTALSQIFHTLIGLIGTAILSSILAVSIVICLLVAFSCLVMLVIYLAYTALEMVALGIVVAVVIGCIAYALETIALTLVGPGRTCTSFLEITASLTTTIRRALSTRFVSLLKSPLFPWWHLGESTTVPESPLALTFGTGMRFYFRFRAIHQKKFPPHWKPRPYWGDGLEGDFGVFPFSQKHLNPLLTEIHHNNQLRSNNKAAGTGGFVGNGIDCDFQSRPASQYEPLESILLQ